MARLVEPTTRVHASFLAAMTEFESEGRGGARDDSVLGSEIRASSTGWDEPQAFARFVADLRAKALEHTPRPEGFVPASTRWWVDGDDYLARIVVRHRLTERLLEAGGHIGYDVRPSVRRRGHATAMLGAVLPLCRDLGIELALVTCDVDNVASRRVIENNDGTFDDQREGKLRFWVPTTPAALP